MGYYTYYQIIEIRNIDFIGGEGESNADMLGRINGTEVAYDMIVKELSEWSDSMKWYDSNSDMAILSEQYPGWLFVLKGEGEDSGDIWRLYAYRGKTHIIKAKIVWPDEQDALRAIGVQ
jgi:hypothetical protein